MNSQASDGSRRRWVALDHLRIPGTWVRSVVGVSVVHCLQNCSKCISCSERRLQSRPKGRRKLVIFNKQTGIIAEGRKQRSLLVATFQRQAAGQVLSSKESRELGFGPSAEASQTGKSMRLEARETESRKLQSAFDIIFSVLESLLLGLKQVPAA